MNLLRQGFRKLSSDRHTDIQTYRQTDRQTDRQMPSKLYTTPLREWSKSSDHIYVSVFAAFRVINDLLITVTKTKTKTKT